MDKFGNCPLCDTAMKPNNGYSAKLQLPPVGMSALSMSPCPRCRALSEHVGDAKWQWTGLFIGKNGERYVAVKDEVQPCQP